MASTEELLPTTVDNSKRRALALNVDLGAGNFLDSALRVSPAPDETILTLERPFRPFFGGVFDNLSLSSLKSAADHYAAWYVRAGVRPKDPVAVYLDDGIEYLVHYIALTSLGAIPVLTNGNMPPEVAARHFRHVGAVGFFLDTAHRAALSGFLTREDTYRFVVTEEDLVVEARPALPEWFPFRHTPSDPIMIAHSSGTTGTPKAVLLQHGPFFHGVRYRMQVSSTGKPERILSALPHSHNCAMAYLMLALLSGNQIYVASDHTGKNLGRRITEFRPTMVVSFPETYVELTEERLSAYDFSSVRFWFNGGDAAHEQHIRTLVALGSREENGKKIPGSVFVDGMGSSEMGFSLLRSVHQPGSNQYDRCVGVPLEWASAAVLGEHGEILPPRVVGRLGVRAPSVTLGYWNDSLLTHQSQLAGYWLTGDLAYTDEEGRIYHVDRVPDVIRTSEGPLYTLASEELLLKHFAEFADCSIVGAPKGDGSFGGIVLVRLRAEQTTERTSERALLGSINQVLDAKGWPRVAAALVVDAAEIPLGTTGKVLKRQLRERFAGLFIDPAHKTAAPKSNGHIVEQPAFAAG
jgi:acyl-coenzyme A synthetase/AMP-(fatty) acid ligase